MSTYYVFKGKLTFADEETAKIAYDHLTRTADSYFFVPEDKIGNPRWEKSVKRSGRTLTIHEENFGGGDVYDTCALVSQVIGISTSGKVLFQDGDDEDGDRYYLSASDELKKKLKPTPKPKRQPKAKKTE
jgi:hypothetical protein